MISEQHTFGKRFLFDERVTEDSEILVYLPMISLLSIEFKHYRNKFRVEIPYMSIYSNNLPQEVIAEKIPKEILSLKLSELDFDKCFIGINWVYLMNLKSKIQLFKHPSFLVYYRFKDCEKQVIDLKPIGV